jgi:hypothetical protein
MFDVQKVIEAAPFGDHRRNVRALEIVTSLIQGSEPRSNDDGVHAPGEAGPWAHTMGCFRFFDNDALTLPLLYEPCREALAQLVPPGRRAYAIYDVSVVNYSGHDAKLDRIRFGHEHCLGYELFSALIVDETGHPLGPLVQEVRTAEGCLSSESTAPFPFVDHYEQAERALRATDFHLPGRDIVAVMDREFDDVLLERWLGDTSRKFVIRAQHLDRKVLLGERPTTLKNAVRAAPRCVVGTVEHDGKTYERRVAETSVVFHGKSRRGRRRGQPRRKGKPLSVRVVIAELYYHGRRAYQWVLLTNLDEPAERVAIIYTWRWRVERLYYLVKVGMRLETWGERNGDRIARRLALCSLAAMAVYQLQAASSNPGYADAIREVATIGGWHAKKNTSLGPIVMMRGMLRFIGAVALIERVGVRELRRLARMISKALGLPLPGVSPPLRKPRGHPARLAADP